MLTHPSVKPGMSVAGYPVEAFAIEGRQAAITGAAQKHRLFDYRVKHGSEIAGRRIDNLQHLGGRSLLLQGLAGFGDEPRILHRDDRLVGKGAHQLDLPFGEGLDPPAHQRYGTEWLTLTQ